MLSFTTSGAMPNLANSAQAKNLAGISLNPLTGTAKGQLASSDPVFNQRPYASPVATALNNSQSSAPAPSTPVKSTIITGADGSSHTTTYHAPDTSGTYKGVEITPGSDQEIAAQIAKINAGGSTNAGGTTPGLIAGPNTPASSTSATPAAPAAAPQQSTFSGYLGQLGDTSKQGSSSAQKYTQQTANYGAGNLGIGKEAAGIAADYGQKIADVGGQGAKFEAGQLTTGTSPVAEGNAAVTAQTTAAQQTALAEGETAALQGTAQELTGQNQAANAANEAAGQAQQGQNLQQTGLQNAASLAQPNATAQGQTVFDPTTGKFTGGSYQENMATVVNAIKNGQIGYTAGVDSLSGLSPTAKADVLAALGPGFDTVSSDANAAARGTNIQTGGTAVTGANAQGLGQSIQEETDLNTAATNAQALAAQVADTLTKVGLTNSTDANTAINNLQSRLGNSAYTQLNIAVNDARNAYGAILQATGATPTDAGAAATQNINANMSPNQIKAAIDQLNQGIQARQKSAHQQTQQYQSQLSGSGQSNGSGGGTVQTKAGPVNTGWN